MDRRWAWGGVLNLIWYAVWALLKGILLAIVFSIIVGRLAPPFAVQAAIYGFGVGALSALTWYSKGRVKSVLHSFDHPGLRGRINYFGRDATAGYSAYGSATDPSPAFFEEVIESLDPLIQRYQLAPLNLGISLATGITAWALVPIPRPTGTPGSGFTEDSPLTPDNFANVNLVMPDDTTPLEGVIVAIGDVTGTSNPDAKTLLQSIGARDAVAMDGSFSVMMGTEDTTFFAPGSARQQILDYGFYMKEI